MLTVKKQRKKSNIEKNLEKTNKEMLEWAKKVAKKSRKIF